MRVLIVDDEPKIIKLIKNLIDWDSLGLEIAGEIRNGIEALRFLKREPVDIVITDIRMPGIDGIQLIGEAIKCKLNVMFIVISGYNDFEYARNALRLGAVDYLLKPISATELKYALIRAIENQKYFDESKDSHSKIRKTFINDTVENKISTSSIEEINKKYKYSFENGDFQGFTIQSDCVSENATQLLVPMQSRISRIFGAEFENLYYDYELEIIGSQILGLCNYSPEVHSHVQLKYQNFLDKLIVLKKELNAPVDFSLGVGNRTKDISQINTSLLEAQKAVNKRLLADVGEVYIANNLEPVLNSEKILAELNYSMDKAIELMDSNRLEETISEFKKQVNESHNVKGWEIIDIINEASERFVMLIKNKGLQLDNLDQQLVEFKENIKRTGSAEIIWKLFSAWISAIINDVSEQMATGMSLAVRESKQYIEDNFDKSVTLEEIGERVNLNSSYLSTLFKKETGSNFLDYLTKVRIEQAKKLLTDTNDTIASIANQVGYSDVKHFNRVFKKHAVLKPNEYRKFYS